MKQTLTTAAISAIANINQVSAFTAMTSPNGNKMLHLELERVLGGPQYGSKIPASKRVMKNGAGI